MRRMVYQRLMLVAVGLGAILSCGTLFSVPALAAEIKQPAIESMSAGVGGEVTVGAQINPGGLDTTYEIRVECRSLGADSPCEPLSNGPRRGGVLAASFAGSEVNLDVTGLQPGSYWFGVIASNSAGTVFQRSNILNIPPVPPGACPNGCSTVKQYESEVPSWFIKEGEEQSARTRAEYEAKQLRALKEQEEEQARAAAFRSVEEAALRQHEVAEQASSTPAPRARTCEVPALRGLTLSAARRALTKAHCRLGKISRLAHRRSAWVVIEQSSRHGKLLPAEAKIAVMMGTAHRRSG